MWIVRHGMGSISGSLFKIILMYYMCAVCDAPVPHGKGYTSHFLSACLIPLLAPSSAVEISVMTPQKDKTRDPMDRRPFCCLLKESSVILQRGVHAHVPAAGSWRWSL